MLNVDAITIIDGITFHKLARLQFPLMGSDDAQCMEFALIGLKQIQILCLRLCISHWLCHLCFKLQPCAQQLCSGQ